VVFQKEETLYLVYRSHYSQQFCVQTLSAKHIVLAPETLFLRKAKTLAAKTVRLSFQDVRDICLILLRCKYVLRRIEKGRAGVIM
jgi:hypothetical protein